MSTRAAEHVVEVLEQVPLFQGLPRSDLEQIAQIVKRRELTAGEFLFREGDAGDRWYLVAAGAVEALKERPLGDHERLAVHRAGDAFGALALLDDAPRSVSARAVEDARLLSVSQSDFHSLLGGDSVAIRLLKGLARSLRALDAGLDGRDAAGGADGLRQFGRTVLHGLEPRAVPHADGFRIAAAAARQDALRVDSFWDVLGMEDGRVVLALLDIQGQGLPPAYLIGIMRAVLHEVGPEESFERLLGRLNSATFKNVFEGLDACVEVALIELAGGRIRWSCARDQPGAIIRADGSAEEAPAHGPPLGILPAFEYEVTTLDLRPGDTFLALTEAPPGLARGAVDLVRSRADADPAELAQLLTAALGKVQTRGGESDVAFVVVRKT
jgi:CRP-like cAMP-binding protein